MFSPLQSHILRECFGKRGEAINRGIFLAFYKDKGVKKEDRVNIITKSLERLIDNGLLVGYGVRTPKKWFIKSVKLTTLGRKKWSAWLASGQAKLPLR